MDARRSLVRGVIECRVPRYAELDKTDGFGRVDRWRRGTPLRHT